MICAHCGCDNPDGIAYCRDCGMTLRSLAPRIAAPTPTPEVSAASAAPAAPAYGAMYGAPQANAQQQQQQQQAQPQPPQPQLSTLRSDQVSSSPGATPGSAPGSASDATCARCGERNPPESRFCHGCGAPQAGSAARVAVQRVAAAVPLASAPAASAAAASAPAASHGAAVVCARCRGIADPGADFCKFCGARLNVAPAEAASAPQPTSPRVQAPAPAPQPVVLPVLAAAPPIEPPRRLDGGKSESDPIGAQSASPPAVSTAAVSPRAAGQGSTQVPGRAPGYAPGSDVSGPVVQGPPHAATRPLHGIGETGVRARLVRIAKDGSEGGHHPIIEAQTDIGRAEGNIILADDPYLSPRHARIVTRSTPDPTRSGALMLVDLASVNGVFVRLRGPHPLTHGDLLLLGQQVLRFEAVTEIEGARGPAMQHGVLLFGSPAPLSRARLVQRTVEGLVRDVIYLVRDEVVVGRESGDRTFPDDVFMSRRHAAIRRENTGYMLHDLGSSNGTFVQIHAEHPLSDGDQFRIGHHLFRIDFPKAAGGGGA